MSHKLRYPLAQPTPPPPSPVETKAVDPMVWSSAVYLAHQEVRRIERIDEKTVIVHNREIR